ncbi:cytoskeletal protein binding protein, partial [Ceratobasidium sp. 423]
MTVLYDFTPDQENSNTGLSVKAGQTLLLLDTPNDEWWRFKIKTDRENNGGSSGFVPKEYTQEAGFVSVAVACGDFVARVDGDLTITEHEALLVYCVEGDWALVKSPHRRETGYVPK